jgi:uncharacterized membrane protein YeaQ/YmgE (transglycosylase-associated protein family)
LGVLAAVSGNLQVGEWYSQTSIIGFTVLSIVGAIVLLLILAAVVTPPIGSRLTGIFILSFILIVVGAVVLTYLLSLVFAVVVP